ncbi:unnamed protein product, partial [Meganyctiphanes norvegica]
ENLNTGVWSHHVYHRAGTYDLTVAADCQGEAIGSKTIRDAFMVVKPITGIYISVLGMDEELALKFSIRNNSAVCSTSPVVLSVTVEEGSHLQEMRLHFGDRNSTIVKHKNFTIASPLAWNVQVVHQYSSPGKFRPWVEVTNPLHTRRSLTKTQIRVSDEPTQIVLEQRRYLMAMEEEVTFVAYACGGHLVYNWTLPDGKNITTVDNALSWSSEEVMDGMVGVSVHSRHLLSQEKPNKQWPK